jgi:cytochrome c553
MVTLCRLPVVAPFVLICGVALPDASPQRIPVPASPERALHLASHAAAAELMRNAIIRGDLAALREPARRLAEGASNPDMAPAHPGATEAMRQAARAAAEAPDLTRAAAAAARLAGACGGCHRLSNVHAALPTSAGSTMGGVVGHMVDHQRAADELYAALVEPSELLWQQGANRLDVVPLRREKLPRDPKLTDALIAAEARVHELVARARQSMNLDERTGVYADILATCSTCHSLHARIWGPPSPR